MNLSHKCSLTGSYKYNMFVQLRELGESDLEHSYKQTSQKKVRFGIRIWKHTCMRPKVLLTKIKNKIFACFIWFTKSYIHCIWFNLAHWFHIIMYTNNMCSIENNEHKRTMFISQECGIDKAAAYQLPVQQIYKWTGYHLATVHSTWSHSSRLRDQISAYADDLILLNLTGFNLI